MDMRELAQKMLHSRTRELQVSRQKETDQALSEFDRRGVLDSGMRHEAIYKINHKFLLDQPLKIVLQIHKELLEKGQEAPDDATRELINSSFRNLLEKAYGDLLKATNQDIKNNRELLGHFHEQIRQDVEKARADYSNEADVLIQLSRVSHPQDSKASGLVERRQDGYEFHPEIEKVSGQLFRNGHYKQAALEAYIRVIDEVKVKSKLDLDGDKLMNRAFGYERQKPLIQFNSLETDAERDEQSGFLYLFKGVVGLRNSNPQQQAV